MDYFPHDVHASADEKLETLIMQYGAKGYAFYFMHLEYIYRSDELEVNVTPMFRRLICAKLQITEAEYEELLQAALEVECFDEAHYRDTGSLTSHGVQKRAEVVFVERARDRERKRGFPQENRNVAPESGSIPELSGGFPPENLGKTPENSGFPPESGSIPELSGLKERKGKEKSISARSSSLPAGDSTPDDSPVVHRVPLIPKDGEYLVTQAMIDAWQKTYPGIDVGYVCGRIVSWCQANPGKRKTRRGAQRFIDNWLAREQDKGGASGKPADNTPKGTNIGGYTFPL